VSTTINHPQSGDVGSHFAPYGKGFVMLAAAAAALLLVPKARRVPSNPFGTLGNGMLRRGKIIFEV